MALVRSVFLPGLLLLSSLPAVGEGNAYQRQYTDWRIHCQPFTGFCTAEVNKSSRPGLAVAEFRLQLRGADNLDPLAMVYIPLSEPPGEGKRIYFTIDGEVPFEAQPGFGWQRHGEANHFAFEERLVRSMLPLLKSGRKVMVSYSNIDEQPVKVTFSLMGLTAALREIQRWRDEDFGRAPRMTMDAETRD